MKKIILSAGILLAGGTAIHAQLSATQNLTLTLQNAINISVTAATGTAFAFDDIAEYQSGLTNTTASTFLVKSNRPWTVTVKSAAATFSGPVAPAAQMPSNVLGVRLTGGTAFGALSTAGSILTTGVKGTNSFSIDYNANPGLIYDAGVYTLSVVYTTTMQ